MQSSKALITGLLCLYLVALQLIMFWTYAVGMMFVMHCNLIVTDTLQVCVARCIDDLAWLMAFSTMFYSRYALVLQEAWFGLLIWCLYA